VIKRGWGGDSRENECSSWELQEREIRGISLKRRREREREKEKRNRRVP